MMPNAQAELYLLPSKIDSLVVIEQLIENIKDHHNIPEDLYGNILVSITEAVNNAIKHGNKLNPDLNVEFTFENTDTNYSFTVKDEGAGFDFNHIADPTLPENVEKPDGRGIFIMKSLADEVEFLMDGRQVNINFRRNLKN